VVVAQAAETSQPSAAPAADAGHVVSAPMIGTFYASPSPGEPPFVSVGDSVEVGQVIGIIEAMKIMNEITADRAGTVSEVFVSNSQPVEYGSPLIRIQLA
jgi:acetyl-CoA carboxylase biotin carboxyl carrier protein